MARKKPTTYPIATRTFKVKTADFGAAPAERDSFVAFWDGLPRILAAESLRRARDAGAHVRVKWQTEEGSHDSSLPRS